MTRTELSDFQKKLKKVNDFVNEAANILEIIDHNKARLENPMPLWTEATTKGIKEQIERLEARFEAMTINTLTEYLNSAIIDA